MSKEYTAPTTEIVEIESSVVLKIVKHASKHFPVPVSGPLLGLDANDKILNISHAFAYPTVRESNEGSSFRLKSNQKFVQDVVEQSKLAGYAAQFVGWYQATTSGNFFNHHAIDGLLHAQISDDANSVLIVHDASKLAKGTFSLRAFRLNETFVQGYINNGNSTKFSRKFLLDNELNYKNILVELPIQVHNSHLVSLFLNDIKLKTNDYQLNDAATNNLIDISTTEEQVQRRNKDGLLANFESLKLAGLADSALTVNKLVDSIDDYNYDLNNFNYYQRQYSRELAKVQQWKQKAKVDNVNRAKDGEKEIDIENDWKPLFKLPTEPSRYDNLLISAGINSFCNDLELDGMGELMKSYVIKSGLDN